MIGLRAAVLAALLLSIGFCAPANAQIQTPPLPLEITGFWSIQETIGTQPMLLEVPSMEALLGRDVEIGRTLRLWDVFEGTVASYREDHMLFRSLLDYPVGALPREIALGNHHFDIYEIGTTDCKSHGKPLADCPVFVIGHDLDTDQVGLVTLPFGFAAFKPRL